MSRFAVQTRGRALVAALLAMAMPLLLTCCTTLPPDARTRHATAYIESLSTRTAQALTGDEPLGLDQCIAIALENNLAVRMAAIDAALAHLDKNMAFADFLPRVTATASTTTWNQQPASTIGGLFQAPTHDQTLRQYGIDVQMPVFMPATWFAYSMRRHGEAAGALAVELTRQAITLEVTSRYYQCLARMASVASMESQLARATVLAGELEARHTEGLVLNWEREAARVNVLARQTMLRESQGMTRLAQVELLQSMGLNPTGELALRPAAPFDSTATPVETLIYQALLAHPDLHLADREHAMAADRTKQAIAAFLPGLSSFLSLTGTSNTTSLPAQNVYGGLAGVLTVFDGFANIQEYQAARQRQAKAALAREERCLAVMAQVFGAHLNERLAGDYLEVAARNLAMQEARVAAVEARAEEGLALPSERLDARALRDQAEMEWTHLNYRHQLSAALLRHAMGVPFDGSGGDAACESE